MADDDTSKSTSIEITVWLDGDTVHMTSDARDDFHVAVNEEEDRPNGHPTLYRRLVDVLRDAGVSVPSGKR